MRLRNNVKIAQRSLSLVRRGWRGLRRGPCGKILDHLGSHEDPDGIDAKGGPKRDIDQVEKTEDDNKDARPFLSIQKSDPSDESGNRQEQEEATYQCPYQSSNGDRSLVSRNESSAGHHKEDRDRAYDTEYAESDVERRKYGNVLLHDHTSF